MAEALYKELQFRALSDSSKKAQYDEMERLNNNEDNNPRKIIKALQLLGLDIGVADTKDKVKNAGYYNGFVVTMAPNSQTPDRIAELQNQISKRTEVTNGLVDLKSKIGQKTFQHKYGDDLYTIKQQGDVVIVSIGVGNNVKTATIQFVLNKYTNQNDPFLVLNKGNGSVAMSNAEIGDFIGKLQNVLNGDELKNFLSREEKKKEDVPAPAKAAPAAAAAPDAAKPAAAAAAEHAQVDLNTFYTTAQAQKENDRPVLGVNVTNVAKKNGVVTEAQLASVRPVVNAEVVELIKEHIKLTMKHGTDVEKVCYKKQIFNNQNYVEGGEITNVHVDNFIQRLINKRPLAFLNASDTHLLRDGTKLKRDFTDLHNMPRSESAAAEYEHFCFENYISYDEMKISAFLHLSADTSFMNDGDRYNQGANKRNEEAKPIVKDGVIIGSVGARFERKGLMEWQDMIVDAEDSYRGVKRADAGYQVNKKKMWAKFYDLPNDRHPTLDEAAGDSTNRYEKLGNNKWFDKLAYKKMLELRLGAVLMEANAKATPEKPAYVHLTGLGLGVWKVSNKQSEIFYDVVVDLLQKLDLPNVSDVDLSYIDGNEAKHAIGTVKEFSKAAKKINLHNTKNNPSALIDAKNGKLLVQDFAWDSNSFGGNEYWLRSYAASGDPAAACSAPVVAHGFNSALNPRMQKQARVVKSLSPVEEKREDELGDLESTVKTRLEKLKGTSKNSFFLNQFS